MKTPSLFLCVAALVGACSCPKYGPIVEKPPDNLDAEGIIIDAPAEGASLTGQWTTVSGWARRDAVQFVAIAGAPVDGFYLPTGHVGIPMVPMSWRADGRFFAPRVPLQDGEVKILVIPFGKHGPFQHLSRTVTAKDTGVVPATVVVSPAQPEPGKSATLRAATVGSTAANFQWDFDGDGTFEAEGATVTHAWPNNGRYQVIARTNVNGAWVSAYAEVKVGSLPDVLFSAKVGVVRGLFVLPRYVVNADIAPDDGIGPRETRYVAVAEENQVSVFDAQLKPLFTLTGLSQPSGVDTDYEGRLYVADTGNDRLLCFNASGQPDLSFGANGEYRGTAQLPMKAPLSVVDLGALVLLKGVLEPLRCGGRPYSCRQVKDEFSKEHLVKYGIGSLTKITKRPEPYLGSVNDNIFALGNGQLLQLSSGWSRRDDFLAVDVALGLSQIEANFVVVDPAGRLLTYLRGDHDATWTLPYRVKGVGISPSGRIYLAGDGVVELRAFDLIE